MKFAVFVLLFGFACHSAVDAARLDFEDESLSDNNINLNDVFGGCAHPEPSSCGCEKETVVKGPPEIVTHQQPDLIVKRPPTMVRINHAPMIVKQSPIVYHRSGDSIRQTIIRQPLQRKIQIRPYTVKVVAKPIEKKVFISKRPSTCGCNSCVSVPKPCNRHESPISQSESFDGVEFLSPSRQSVIEESVDPMISL